MRKTGRKAKERKAQCRAWSAFQYWLSREIRLATSSIEWPGMPDTVDQIYLESILIKRGSAVIFRDDVTGEFVCGSNSSDGRLDWYGYPDHRIVTMRNGDTFRVSVEDSIIIYNNSLRESDMPYLLYVAGIMSDISSAIRVNVNTQKTMPMVPASIEQQLSIKNVLEDLDNNMPYVLLDNNSLNVEALKNALVFDNRKSFTGDLLIATRREEWNNFLTFNGVDNSNIEKKAQVNILESGSNLEEVLYMKRSKLNSRKEGCKLMKMKWGLNVDVQYYGQERRNQSGDIYNAGQNRVRTDVPEPSQLT